MQNRPDERKLLKLCSSFFFPGVFLHLFFTLSFLAAFLILLHGDLRSFSTVVCCKNIDYFGGVEDELKIGEANAKDLQKQGLAIVRVEVRNLGCLRSEIQGVSVPSTGCKTLCLTPLPLKLEAFSVKELRFIVDTANARSFRVSFVRDGVSEIANL